MVGTTISGDTTVEVVVDVEIDAESDGTIVGLGVVVVVDTTVTGIGTAVIAYGENASRLGLPKPMLDNAPCVAADFNLSSTSD